MEGARFGVIMGLFLSVPMAYGTYMIIPIPFNLAVQWFLYGTAQSIVYGVVAAAIYKPKAAAFKPKAAAA